MSRNVDRILATLVALGMTSFAMAQSTTPQQQPSETETTPSSASSPHQRQATGMEADEAPTTSESDPEASSSRHQRETTRTRTAEAPTSSSEDQMLNSCMEKLKANDPNITDYNAEKACREHARKNN